jgi:hypothetical protein
MVAIAAAIGPSVFFVMLVAGMVKCRDPPHPWRPWGKEDSILE